MLFSNLQRNCEKPAKLGLLPLRYFFAPGTLLVEGQIDACSELLVFAGTKAAADFDQALD